jgi:hypothetical protein
LAVQRPRTVFGGFVTCDETLGGFGMLDDSLGGFGMVDGSGTDAKGGDKTTGGSRAGVWSDSAGRTAD